MRTVLTKTDMKPYCWWWQYWPPNTLYLICPQCHLHQKEQRKQLFCISLINQCSIVLSYCTIYITLKLLKDAINLQISILLNLFMSKKWDNEYSPRQIYISIDNLKDISLPYNTTHKHKYVNVIEPIVYVNHVVKKFECKSECVVYSSHKSFPKGILS